jgi:bacillithiol system protein YtxJ
MNWIQLEEEQELERIKQESHQQPVLIFKHSTRCSISATALNRLERKWEESEMQNIRPYYLDLIKFRPMSQKIAADLNVVHESPQVLLVHNGEAVYSASHMSISYDEIKEELEKLKVQ